MQACEFVFILTCVGVAAEIFIGCSLPGKEFPECSFAIENLVGVWVDSSDA